jgi:hypothetical protein
MISRGKGNNRRVPCTCNTRILLATRMGLSFLSISRSRCTQKVELAYTLMVGYFPFPFSSGRGREGRTLILTPSVSGLSISRPTILTSNEKLMLEQFLKGIFMDPLLGILMILVPERLSSNSLRQMTWGTSPRLWIGRMTGVSSST